MSYGEEHGLPDPDQGTPYSHLPNPSQFFTQRDQDLLNYILNPDGTLRASVVSSLDHGSFSGLGDDDHTQYLLIDGTRAMTGDLTLGGNIYQGSSTVLFIYAGQVTLGVVGGSSSSVNYLQVINAIAGSPSLPSILAVGDSDDINVNLVPKGVGRVSDNGVTIPTISSTDTLTNKTLTTPTIGDMSNAQHDHADAAGGGSLAASAVNSAGAVMEADFDAHTILQAASDNTPVALTIGASTIVGRKATGNIVALTAGETRTILNVEDGSTADQTAGEIEAIVDHDLLVGFEAGEHVAEASLSIAGSQLTGTVSAARLEAKMKTYSKVFYLGDPVADNIYPLAWLHGADAISLGRFGGTVDTGTAVLQLVDRPITAAFSGGTNRLSGNLTVDTAYTDGDDSTTSFSGGAGLSDTSLWVKVVSVTGSPTKLLVFLEASVDD